MRKNPWIAGVLSLVFLGLGHVYVGKKALGAALMIAFIVIGNLNALWLSAYALTPGDSGFFSLTLPRLLHDVFAFYGIALWIWAIVDSVTLAKQTGHTDAS
jgi:hypothetical protein